MIDRCTNPCHKHFSYYGGRGIKVCLRWLLSYEAFRDDMGHRPAGMTLDRIDGNGNYNKSNCRWATRETQQNNMRSNTIVAIGSETKTLSRWVKQFGTAYSQLAGIRIKRGWDPIRAFTVPARKYGGSH